MSILCSTGCVISLCCYVQLTGTRQGFLFFGVLALNQHVSPLAHGEVHDNGYCRYSAPFTWKLLCLLRACKKMIGWEHGQWNSRDLWPLPMIHLLWGTHNRWRSDGWRLPISAISFIGICWGDDPDSNFQAFFASTKLALWWLPEATTKRYNRWKRACAGQEFGARTVRVDYAFGFIL